MYANNNLYFVRNLVTEIYFSRSCSHLCVSGRRECFLANLPFPLSSIIPFVQLTHVFLFTQRWRTRFSSVLACKGTAFKRFLSKNCLIFLNPQPVWRDRNLQVVDDMRNLLFDGV